MPEVEPSAGTIEYEDTGGDDPVPVLLHGVSMDGSLWRHVAAGRPPTPEPPETSSGIRHEPVPI